MRQLWKGRVTGTPRSMHRRGRRQGGRGRRGWVSRSPRHARRPPPATGAGERPRAAEDAAALPWATGMSAAPPRSHSLPGPGDTDIRTLPEVPVGPPFAQPRSASHSRPHASPGLPSLSPAVGSGRWLHPPPLILPPPPPPPSSSAPIGLAAPRAALTWPAEWGWPPKAARPRSRRGQLGPRSGSGSTLSWPSLMDSSSS